MDFVKKQCIGCGTLFVCLEDFDVEVLYCNEVCESSHSIFNDTTAPGQQS